jgi:hypothetical protein
MHPSADRSPSLSCDTSSGYRCWGTRTNPAVAQVLIERAEVNAMEPASAVAIVVILASLAAFAPGWFIRRDR